MRTVGVVTTLLLSGAAVGALVVGVQSLPDIRRYLRMRAM
jgi:hypothetical protein